MASGSYGVHPNEISPTSTTSATNIAPSSSDARERALNRCPGRVSGLGTWAAAGMAADNPDVFRAVVPLRSCPRAIPLT